MKLGFYHLFHLLVMKLVFNKNSLILFLIVVISGCVKELNPETNGYKEKPVIWALLNPDSIVKIITSGNQGLEENDKVNISSIDMFLYEEGAKVDSLLAQKITNASQMHSFNIIPKNSKTYILKILNKDLEISGSTIIPRILSKPFEIKLTQGENAQLSYTISDNILSADAYQFDVEIYHYGILTDTATDDTLSKSYVFVKPFDKYDEPTLNYNFLGLNNFGTSKLTYPVIDNLFNGKNRTFLFTLQNPVSNIFFRPRNSTLVSDKLICSKQYVLIRCRNISPDYYKFIVSENRNSAIFGTPYFNPTNVYSNISGGLGLIGGITERTDTVWIRK